MHLGKRDLFGSPARPGAAGFGAIALVGCLLAVTAVPSPAVASVRLGCPHRTVAPLYHLTHPISRRIRGDFLRHHRRYQIVAVGTSLLAPQGCVGVFYLRPGGQKGAYGLGGLAYYYYGRAVRHPSRDAILGLHAVGLMSAISRGTGTYAFTETGPDAVGGVATFSGRTTFQWTNVYGDARHPFELGADSLGENLAGEPPVYSSAVTGLTSYSYTDSSDPSGNFACQVPLVASGHAGFQWSPFAHFEGMRFGQEFSYLPVDEQGRPPDDSDPSEWRACQSISPLDPTPTQVQTYLEIGFERMLVSPSIDGHVMSWMPFTAPLALHHHKHLDADPNSGEPASEQDLSMTGAIQFTLRGVRPAG
jgi:hypothetical protein